MGYVITAAAMVIFCVLDIAKIIDITQKKWFIFYIILAPHLPLMLYHYMHSEPMNDRVGGLLGIMLVIGASVLFQLYTTLRLHFQTMRKGKTDNKRVNIIYSGRNLLKCGMWGLYLLPLWYAACVFISPFKPYADIGSRWLIAAEIIYSVIFVGLFMLNGGLRIFFASRNLVIAKRIIIVLFMWVPIVNIYLVHIMCRIAKDEYLVTVSRSENEAFTIEDNACMTKYPLILVHGIGFRDLRYFNYWGRIPNILKQHGARVYYGHQNAWGTIEDNAAAISKVVDTALEENKCDRVNIIAHSKGGLDCRYLISSLGYADRVASLTTINTPHRGSEIITILNKLPDGVYRFIAGQLGKPFMLAGEKEPDCYSSSKQLDPVYCEKFNETNKDSSKVYYQSYTSIMNGVFSDSLLSIPYLLMCTKKGRQNDGLVDVSSAKWGEFKGILESSSGRGISHGDMIDLKRDDIEGFDVLNEFYDIVCDLKKEGY